MEKAQIARRSLAKEREFGRANQGHQIQTGSRSVLAIRIYENEDRGPDSALFYKSTLEFSRPIGIAESEEITVDVLRSLYTEGGSAWVDDGAYWWATDPFRHVHFRRDSKGLYATLKQNVRATYDAKVVPRPPQSIPVDVTCQVRKLPVLKLTPWTGRVGTEWLSFYTQGVVE